MLAVDFRYCNIYNSEFAPKTVPIPGLLPCPVVNKFSQSVVPASYRKRDALSLPNRPLELHATGEDILS